MIKRQFVQSNKKLTGNIDAMISGDLHDHPTLIFDKPVNIKKVRLTYSINAVSAPSGRVNYGVSGWQIVVDNPSMNECVFENLTNVYGICLYASGVENAVFHLDEIEYV